MDEWLDLMANIKRLEDTHIKKEADRFYEHMRCFNFFNIYYYFYYYYSILFLFL